MALAAARHFLTRVVHDQYDVAGSAGSERLHKASRVAHRLGEIETAVTEVLLLNESGFTSKLDSYGRIVELIENGVGRFFNDENFQMGKVIGGDRGEILDRYRVRPKVQLFFDVCARHPVGQYGAQYFAAHPASRTPDGKQFLWESYNELIEMMRAEAEARRLDKLDIANTFRSTRAFNSMMAVVKRCFAKRSRIFVVCMDVFYHADWADKVTADLARDHHATFMNRLRGRAAIRKNLIGAIWKLDWSETRGHYFRWVFMFDGESVYGTWECEELVDDLWKSIVPRNAGLTNLLNEARFFKLGTGMIDLKENRKKLDAFVESVIRYFAYKDQYLCIKRNRGTRTSDSLILGGKCAGMTKADLVDDLQATSDLTS
ncbi:inovirus-type Gp2 protein [Burkholderia pyrrocinia]|uniref:inovirus-type Gp2 protein n=1 Tax=Burkholderia pyrrocinia TaxID=60550 RepID=UPI001BCD5287|nr:inovirus-type Gp2 protein [Burkholderia pyrrocinia]QVN17106.1 inovirus-type Gp2 protein [Burkholderia pyrrocinia]